MLAEVDAKSITFTNLSPKLGYGFCPMYVYQDGHQMSAACLSQCFKQLQISVISDVC